MVVSNAARRPAVLILMVCVMGGCGQTNAPPHAPEAAPPSPTHPASERAAPSPAGAAVAPEEQAPAAAAAPEASAPPAELEASDKLDRVFESPRPAARRTERGPVSNGYSFVRVQFATDRQRTGSEVPAEAFSGERGPLAYGYCDVSIPLIHEPGELESPSVWRLEFEPNAAKHVILATVTVVDGVRFFNDLAARVARSAGKRAFVFVHGYNVTFEDAARRTAQMAYDLKFDGAPVFFSWPARGRTVDYTVDENNAEWAQSDLKVFLADFLRRSTADRVYLIAHSMGSRPLSRAVAELLDDQPGLHARLAEIILAAPDIDADTFKRDIAPRLTSGGRPITLYASSTDEAMNASKRVHGAQRLGDAAGSVFVFPGIETIDASGLDTGFLKHSYFAESGTVISDLRKIIATGLRAGSRERLQPVATPAGSYWRFSR